MVTQTGVDGIMAARGLLQNPGLFAGNAVTPLLACQRYLKIAIQVGTHPFVVHHHLMYMLEAHMSTWEKKRFNVCTSIPSMIDWFREFYGWEFPQTIS
jgi:tRNA-dihydrouridine synthase 4